MAVPTTHRITVWRKQGVNSFGESIYAAPEEINAFWIDDQKRTEDAESEQFMSMAKVLSEERDFVALEDRMQWEDLASADIDKSYVVKRLKYVESPRTPSRLATAILGS